MALVLLLAILPGLPAQNAYATSASISCTVTSVLVYGFTQCTATFGGTSPDGNINWSSTRQGGFYPPSCDSGSEIHHSTDVQCTAYYVPTSLASPVTITASFAGDSNNPPTSGSTDLAVTTSPTSALVNCFPSTVPVGLVATCTIYLSYNMYQIVNYPNATPPPPTGTVQWTSSGGQGSFNSTSCTLPPESCTVTYAPSSSASPVTITANYPGNGFYQPASSTYQLAITAGRTSTTSSTTSSSSASTSTPSKTLTTASTSANSTSLGSTVGGFTLPNYWPEASLAIVAGLGLFGYYLYQRGWPSDDDERYEKSEDVRGVLDRLRWKKPEKPTIEPDTPITPLPYTPVTLPPLPPELVITGTPPIVVPVTPEPVTPVTPTSPTPVTPSETPVQQHDEHGPGCVISYRWQHQLMDLFIFPNNKAVGKVLKYAKTTKRGAFQFVTAAEEPVPLRAESSDWHLLIHECSCPGIDGDLSRKSYALPANLRVTWNLEQGEGGFVNRSEGSLLSENWGLPAPVDGGDEVLFQPGPIDRPEPGSKPSVVTSVAKKVKIRVTAYHDDLTKPPDHEPIQTFITMEITRRVTIKEPVKESPFYDVVDEYVYDYWVDPEPLVSGAEVEDMLGDCQPGHSWPGRDPISAKISMMPETCETGEYVRFVAVGGDTDDLELTCTPSGKACKKGTTLLMTGLSDILTFSWHADKGEFPRGAEHETDSRLDQGNSVIWHAPAEEGTVSIRLRVNDSGREFPDKTLTIEKKIKVERPPSTDAPPPTTKPDGPATRPHHISHDSSNRDVTRQ
ncbi:MAG: hypothetical protein OK438_01280 [Thaumarchaeota archaeon]|nr:hypothetical protein [Nitrososphaerota archaeon]